MGFAYILTKDEIREYKCLCQSALRGGAVMKLTLPGVGSEAFCSNDQLDDWLRDDGDNPYAEYEVRFLTEEPECL